MTAMAAVAGYLIGSIPTAGFLGQLRGIDLRSEGSGNPGTANALRTSGPWLAAAILLVEAAKGYAAVRVGDMVAGDAGAVGAGLGAVAGNVYNLWYRFEGGKGLGISLGVLLGLWPTVVPIMVGVIAAGALISRSAGLASLIAMVTLIAMAVLWSTYGWATGGIESDAQLMILSVGMGLLIFWRHWRDSPLSSSPARS